MRTNLGPAQPAAKRYSRGVRERARREPREPRPAPPAPGEAREATALLLADAPGRRSQRGRRAEPLRASPRPARHAIRRRGVSGGGDASPPTARIQIGAGTVGSSHPPGRDGAAVRAAEGVRRDGGGAGREENGPARRGGAERERGAARGGGGGEGVARGQARRRGGRRRRDGREGGRGHGGCDGRGGGEDRGTSPLCFFNINKFIYNFLCFSFLGGFCILL